MCFLRHLQFAKHQIHKNPNNVYNSGMAAHFRESNKIKEHNEKKTYKTNENKSERAKAMWGKKKSAAINCISSDAKQKRQYYQQ